MQPSRRASIGLEKRERTRSNLIAAAYRVFARKEADAVTIDDIIAEAAVARGKSSPPLLSLSAMK